MTPSKDSLSPKSCPLSREFHQVPVTSLAFCNSAKGELFVLAGEDTDLKVYNHQSGRLVNQIGIFHEQSIHGIHVHQVHDGAGSRRSVGGQVLFWGSRYVATVSLADVLEEPRESAVILTLKAPDWIYDGKISPSNSSVAVLATAHNEVVYLHIDHHAGTITVEHVVSPARPILYSAELCWLEDSTVLMVAGTAFGEILVWKSLPGSGSGAGSHEMLLVLTGHEGSIYGVRISPLLTTPGYGRDSATRLLASCSDDRTIRIWDITERKDQKRQIYGDGHFSDARETGFSAILPDQEQPTQGAVQPVAVAMGHLSRIWGVEFAASEGDPLDETGLGIYSFGEDSTCQKWQLTLDPTIVSGSDDRSFLSLKGQLSHEQSFTSHDGKHLWSHCLQKHGGKHLLLTGGADGRVSSLEEASSRSEERLDAPKGLTTLNVPLLEKLPSQKKAESLGRFEFVSQDQLVGVTTHGRLLLACFDQGTIEWKQLIDNTAEEGLKGCCVISRLSEGMAVLGTAFGGIYLLDVQDERLKHIVNVPGKIVDVYYLCREPGRAAIELLVHSFGSSPLYLKLNRETGEILAQIEVSCLDHRFIMTSASRISDYLFVGSRHGYLSVVRDIDGTFESVLDLPPQTPDSVTSIIPLPRRQNQAGLVPSGSILVLTTSRDGRYRIWDFKGGKTNPRLQLCHDSSLPFGPLIEGAWFTSDPNPELILYGFKSKNFVVWNDTRKEERMSFECGGGHRTFSFHHGDSDTEALRIAFNKSAKLYVHSQTDASHSTRPLRTGHHGREIRALSHNGRYLATGSEDTSIRIWEYQDPQADEYPPDRALRCVASIKTHVVGIQTIKWLGSDYLFSCGGNEEFFVWRVRSLGPSYTGLAVVCEAVFEDRSADGDLRIMDFDAQRSRSHDQAVGEGEAEDDGEIIMSMVFSSSAFRTYRYTAQGGFECLIKGAYTGACLTQIRQLSSNRVTLHGQGQGHDLTVLTAATDGHVAIWRSVYNADQGRMVFAQERIVRAHQSSIKCLDLVALGPESFCVVTGGDDNAMGVIMIARVQDSDHGAGEDERGRLFEVLHHGIVRRAHAAAVNSIVAIQQGPPEAGILVITVSNDQRLKAWRVPASLDDGPHQQHQVKLLADAYSAVADATAVEYLEEQGKIMVGGVGLEVWDLATTAAAAGS